jgi:hypothetical protein
MCKGVVKPQPPRQHTYDEQTHDGGGSHDLESDLSREGLSI